MLSAEQACANAEEEISSWDWNAVQGAAADQWRTVLGYVGADLGKENATVLELLYSSVSQIRIVVTDGNELTGLVAVPRKPGASEPHPREPLLGKLRTLLRRALLVHLLCYLLCAFADCIPTQSSWDTFRTVHPLQALLYPRAWADIVRTYVDGWRHTGYIPECRANTKACVLSFFSSHCGSLTLSTVQWLCPRRQRRHAHPG
jgi:hypothetical protein